MIGTASRRPGRAARAAAVLALFLVLAGMALWAAPVNAARPPETFRTPPFGELTLYAPDRPPEEVVLFLSGDGGWRLGVVAMAERLRDLGALVVGIDIRKFQRQLELGGGTCVYPAGPLEELARAVELKAGMPEYKRPILAGYSSGATLVYAALAAAPAETFAGGISLGFCPDIEIDKRPCPGRTLQSTRRAKGRGYDLAAAQELGVPWMVLQGDVDQVCAPEATRRYVAEIPAARLFWLPKVGHGFGVTRRWDPAYVEAYRALSQARAKRAAREAPVPSVPAVADLPLVEVPSTASPAAGAAREVMAVMLSGDGGWAGIDKGVADELARQGVPVVGWSSLRYFWKPRTPEGAAADLARVLEHYRSAWGRPRVLIAGYSFGADVLPFMVTRLPAAQRRAVAGVGLIGLSPRASFEFHVTGWLSDSGDERYPTPQEVDRLGVPTVCLVGAEEHATACHATRARIVALAGGHHFGGDYARLARELLALVAEAPASAAVTPASEVHR